VLEKPHTLPNIDLPYIAVSIAHSVHLPVAIMFKRSLFRQQRAVAQSLSRTAQSQRSACSSFAPTPLRSSPAIRQYTGRRWQSTEAEKNADEPAKTADDAAKTEEDPIKKELEAKSKEVVDLKVCCLPPAAGLRR
jgi:hypothetical protein